MGTKAVIAVLVIVVALFVATLVAGSGQRDGNAGAERGGPLGALLDSVSGSNDVPRSKLSARCLRPDGVLFVRGRCRLRVAAGGDELRTVRLVALDPVTVSAPAPDPDGAGVQVSNQVEPEPDDPESARATIAVGAGDTVITLRCSLCRVALNGGST